MFIADNNTLVRVPESGGTVTPVTTLDASRSESCNCWPYFLPDGKHFLYFAESTAKPENNAIFVGSLDSKDRKLLVKASSNPVYVTEGYLLYNRLGTLMAQPFDADRLQLTGDAVPIAEGLAFNPLGSVRAVFSLRQWRAGLSRRRRSGSAHPRVGEPRRGGSTPCRDAPQLHLPEDFARRETSRRRNRRRWRRTSLDLRHDARCHEPADVRRDSQP